MSGLSRRCEIIARARRTADSSSCSCAIVVGVSLPAGWPPRFGPSFARDSVLLSLLRTCVFDSGHGFSPASQRNWQQRLEPWPRTIASARVFWFCASPPFFPAKILRQDRVGSTITHSVDLQHPSISAVRRFISSPLSNGTWAMISTTDHLSRRGRSRSACSGTPAINSATLLGASDWIVRGILRCVGGSQIDFILCVISVCDLALTLQNLLKKDRVCP